MSSGIKLSVIIPAFNEQNRILSTLETVHAYLEMQPYRSEVIVVDDCSRDETREVVKSFLIGKPHWRLLTAERNRGKGNAVRRGMLDASGDYRLFSDADLSTPIEHAAEFMASGYDVVIGSRRVKGANVAKRQPIMREAAGRVFSVLVRLITMRGFIDTQCGFKMFTAKAATDIFSRQTINRFGFDVEILYIAKKLGYKILEAPVTWIDSPATRVRLFRDSTHMFTDLIMIRVNDLLSRYD